MRQIDKTHVNLHTNYTYVPDKQVHRMKYSVE